jgi:hypothetical protein
MSGIFFSSQIVARTLGSRPHWRSLAPGNRNHSSSNLRFRTSRQHYSHTTRSSFRYNRSLVASERHGPAVVVILHLLSGPTPSPGSALPRLGGHLTPFTKHPCNARSVSIERSLPSPSPIAAAQSRITRVATSGLELPFGGCYPTRRLDSDTTGDEAESHRGHKTLVTELFGVYPRRCHFFIHLVT